MTEAETCPPRGIFNNEATGTVTGVREALSGRWSGGGEGKVGQTRLLKT